MRGVLAVMADKDFCVLASVLGHAGHFWLLYKGGLGSRRQHERWCERGWGLMRV